MLLMEPDIWTLLNNSCFNKLVTLYGSLLLLGITRCVHRRARLGLLHGKVEATGSHVFGDLVHHKRPTAAAYVLTYFLATACSASTRHVSIQVLQQVFHVKHNSTIIRRIC